MLYLLVIVSALGFAVENDDSFIPLKVNHQAFSQSRIGEKLTGGDPSKFDAIIKDKYEVSNFLKCTLIPGFGNNEQKATKRMLNFYNQYFTYLEVSSEAFAMPFAFSACTMLIETHLNNEAVNRSSGAATIAQFLPSTYKQLHKELEDVKNKDRAKEKFDEMSKEEGFDLFKSKSKNFFVRAYQFTLRKGSHYDTTVDKNGGHTLRKGQLFTYEINKQLTEEMHKAIKQAAKRMTDAEYKRHFKNPRTERGPYEEDLIPPATLAQAKNKPLWLMIMKVMYLKQIALRANLNFNPDGFKANDDYIGYLAVVAGAYNRGPDKLLRSVKKPNGSIKAWCENLKTKDETRKYMLSMRRCLVKGSNFAMERNKIADTPQCRQVADGVSDIENACDQIYAAGDGKIYDMTLPPEKIKVYDMTQPGEPLIEVDP